MLPVQNAWPLMNPVLPRALLPNLADTIVSPVLVLIPLQEAHARRGAHWTFDAEKFVDCVRSVRDSCGVKAPSFDHGVGDPVPNDIWITRDHRYEIITQHSTSHWTATRQPLRLLC
jgi:hypothetical protein